MKHVKLILLAAAAGSAAFAQSPRAVVPPAAGAEPAAAPAPASLSPAAAAAAFATTPPAAPVKLAQAAVPAAAPAAAPAADTSAMDPKARAKQIAAWKRQYGEGPYPDETEAFLANKPDALKPYWSNLWFGGERNAVVNFQRLGLAAMEVGDYATAEKAFDQALQRIETVYAKDALASRARDTFAKEANKDFKGEPYERAMAYYYRGLLYLRKGDYGNARASFKGAEYQDTVSEAEEFQSDFAVMNYLIGWSTRCMGESDGKADFDVAALAQPGITMPPKGHNVLMIAETGAGPIKAQDGAMKEKLVFRIPEANPPEKQTLFQLASTGLKPEVAPALQMSSLGFQATTRGGRAIDGILKGKANFKQTTGAIGSGAMNMGLAMMGQGGDTGTAGAVMAGVGALFSMFSSAAKADADIRYWDQLPDGLSIATGVAKGPAKVDVRFMGDSGPLDMKPAVVMQGGDNSCQVVWTRSRSALVSGDVPGDDARVKAAVAKRKDAVAKNKLLRDTLVQL
jgi:tetratricopeptide (TPR) repeat protein